jgi:hypothetical protein
MANNYFREIFDYPIIEFRNHLGQDANDRIIFSGKYGMGKTKFLENFFSSSNQLNLFQQEKYIVYRIFPTNYSIASNEDIIRYIKYDIILEMLKKSITIEEIKLSLLDTLPEFLQNNLHKVVASLVYMIPKLGKEIVDTFDRIDKLKEEFLAANEKANISAGDRLIQYLETIENKEGSLFENDITTKIITESIKRVDEQELILVIDDLDRLDPEHVFRILNVFASHFDSNEHSTFKNKFNFNKIILVCDFHNIRNIFHHRYGPEVDFMGYIDKFYSNEIYHFDNKNAIKGILGNLLNSIIFKLHETESDDVFRQLYFKDNFLQDLLSLLITQNLISLRNIIKSYGKTIDYHHDKLTFSKDIQGIITWKSPFLMQLRLLRDFFGEFRTLKSTIRKLTLTADFFETHESKFAESLYILSYKTHVFNPRKDILTNFQGNPILMDARSIYPHQFIFSFAPLYHADFGTTKEPLRGSEYHVSMQMLEDIFPNVLDLLHEINYLK